MSDRTPTSMTDAINLLNNCRAGRAKKREIATRKLHEQAATIERLGGAVEAAAAIFDAQGFKDTAAEFRVVLAGQSQSQEVGTNG